MLDITKLQLNPIPLPVIDLQNANNNLQSKNSMLTNILTVGGVIAILYFGAKISTYIKNEKVNKSKSQ